MTKHDFKLHTIETAPEAARKDLAEVRQKFGRVPNFFAVAAESPAAINACVSLSNIFRTTALTPAEQQIVIVAASVENKCEYCIAAHSRGAKMAGVPEDVIQAIRDRSPEGREDRGAVSYRERDCRKTRLAFGWRRRGLPRSWLFQIAAARRDGRHLDENPQQLH
jgi:AhpD family alkylhydroperoxidase